MFDQNMKERCRQNDVDNLKCYDGAGIASGVGIGCGGHRRQAGQSNDRAIEMVIWPVDRKKVVPNCLSISSP